ncbi:hypothetical protein L6452_00548 [Arctium lappa]|uniref:Uncharacterized protein n=1 Tax=Arctium lappa TaxID=4217 RepID=A0ACB9FEM6_ARCLA|nr:hypothetical protein L6452_00548 [Arctium lappa]
MQHEVAAKEIEGLEIGIEEEDGSLEATEIAGTVDVIIAADVEERTTKSSKEVCRETSSSLELEALVSLVTLAFLEGPKELTDGRLEPVVAAGLAVEETSCVVAEVEEWRERRERRVEIRTSLSSGLTSRER